LNAFLRRGVGSRAVKEVYGLTFKDHYPDEVACSDRSRDQPLYTANFPNVAGIAQTMAIELGIIVATSIITLGTHLGPVVVIEGYRIRYYPTAILLKEALPMCPT